MTDGCRRVGLLGGTFDPPHYGHLLLAQEAAWQLQLEQVLFLPARLNPLKQAEPTSSAEHRVRMVELAIADNPLFALSRAELDRPPPSYTVHLLRNLHQEWGEDCDLFFLSGADVLAELASWYQPEEVLRLATLVAVGRPGWPAPDISHLAARVPLARTRVLPLQMLGVDISSTEIRTRLRTGHPVHYLLPPAVAAYAMDHALYR